MISGDVNPALLVRLALVRELLTTNGATESAGAVDAAILELHRLAGERGCVECRRLDPAGLIGTAIFCARHARRAEDK